MAGDDDEFDAIWGAPAARRVNGDGSPQSSSEEEDSAAANGSQDSYFVGSEADSEDSAIKRRREAEALILDRDAPAQPQQEQTVKLALPSASTAFDEVDGPPAFLNPEATRPLADSVHRQKVYEQQLAASANAGQAPQQDHKRRRKGPKVAGDDWDISKLAPTLPGERYSPHRTILFQKKRTVKTETLPFRKTPTQPFTPPQQKDKSESYSHLPRQPRVQEKGVVAGAAVRYRFDDDDQGQVSAAAVAMLGGQLHDPSGDAEVQDHHVDARVGPVGPTRAPLPAGAGKKGPSDAMPVDKFLDRGLGGAQLPRNNQDRKDREKNKRMRGQSSHSQWKSEAEMVLRQQYD